MSIRGLGPSAGPSTFPRHAPPTRQEAPSAPPDTLSLAPKTSEASGPAPRHPLPPTEPTAVSLPLPPDMVTHVVELAIRELPQRAAARTLGQLSTVNKAWRAFVQETEQACLMTSTAKITYTAQRLMREMIQSSAKAPKAAKLGIARVQLADAVNDTPYLSIDFQRIPPEMGGLLVDVLAEHPRLQHLEISVPADFHAMNDLMVMLAEQPEVLRRLNIVGSKGPAAELDMARLAQALQAQPRLTVLNLAATPLTLAKPMEEALSSLTRLHRLDLSDNKLKGEDIQSLIRALPSMQALQHIHLSHNILNTQAAVLLSHALSGHVHLRHLDLHNNELGSHGAIALAPRMAQLESLTLSRNAIRNSGGLAIADHLARPVRTSGSTDPCVPGRLRRLDLNHNPLGDVAISALARALPQHSALEVLDLGDTRIGVVGFRALTQALHSLPNLKAFSLQENPLGHTGMAPLAKALPHLPRLQELNLNGIALDTNGMRDLQLPLQGLSELRRLKLGNNRLCDGAKELGQALKYLPGLQSLHLDATRLTPNRLRHLAGGLKHCTGLRVLNLQDNPLATEGALPLAGVLQQMTDLRQLNLNATLLGDTGIDQLVHVLQDLPLQLLQIRYNNINGTALRARLPALPFRA